MTRNVVHFVVFKVVGMMLTLQYGESGTGDSWVVAQVVAPEVWVVASSVYTG